MSGALLELHVGRGGPSCEGGFGGGESFVCLFCLLNWDLIRRALWGPLEDDDFSFVPFSRRAAVG